jgi:hypothetical protein
MSVVPFTFASQTGQIALSELDVNFANVKAFADTAGNVTGNAQGNITSVGILTSLTSAGNITAPLFLGSLIGNVSGNISGNLVVAGANRQVVFNDGGIANATAGMIFNKVGNSFSVNGNVIGANIFASGNGTIAGNLIVSTSGEFGIPSTQTILSLANVRAETIYIGDQKGTNVYIANTTSNTYFGGNTTANGWIYGNALFSTSGNIGVSPGVTTLRLGNINPTTIWIGGNAGNVNLANVNSNTQVSGNLITGGNLSVTGTSTLTGNATAPTAANGTNSTQVATTAFVGNAIKNYLPSGVILMWSGTVASIPAGWFLCDGGNSTPDLRDRFVVGAGSTYTPGNTGGSANAIVVSHTHTASSVVSDPGHSHGYTSPASATSDATGFDTEIAATAAANTAAATTGITVATTVNSTGSSATNANLPPYYALAYIMKA